MSKKQERDNLIIEKYIEKKSLRKVGALFNLSHERVRNILAKNCIKSYPQGKVDI